VTLRMGPILLFWTAAAGHVYCLSVACVSANASMPPLPRERTAIRGFKTLIPTHNSLAIAHFCNKIGTKRTCVLNPMVSDTVQLGIAFQPARMVAQVSLPVFSGPLRVALTSRPA
jgi:hypothetical protein